MKLTFKKVMSVLFAVVMIFGIVGNLFSTKSSAAKITDYEVGDIIEFGWYPQSKVTDESLIATLNEIDGEWISYGYYSGTGVSYIGQMVSGDYMRYKDVEYELEKYRGVIFDTYRPWLTDEQSTTSSSNSYQADNGYYIDTVYWFKYEPIKWRVLDPETGMILCENIIDSQAYNNYEIHSGRDEYGYEAFWGDPMKTYYANNYAESSIRKWLNEDFFNIAFSAVQQEAVLCTTLDNSAYDKCFSAYDAKTTYDKVYLLSWEEALNKDYGFNLLYSESDTQRKTTGSDYAKCQGLNVYSGLGYEGYSFWHLRTPGNDNYFACNVGYDGRVFSYGVPTICSYSGVRPAMNLNLNTDVTQYQNPNVSETHAHLYDWSTTKQPTCLEDGVMTYICKCGDSYTEAIPKYGHSYAFNLLGMFYCSRCGDFQINPGFFFQLLKEFFTNLFNIFI